MNHQRARGQQQGNRSAIDMYQGPIPPPDLLASYQNIDPELPAVIMKMATDEQKHRHLQNEKNNRTERAVMRSDAIIRFLIPILATLVALGILGAAAYAFYKELEWAGSVVSLGFIMGILYAFSRFMALTKNNSVPRR